MSRIGAVINVESTGPGGPDILLQAAGDWTARAYARAAPRPRGSAIGQDIFDLGVLPGDTDFRIVASSLDGHLPGVDIVSLLDAAAYHTDRDVPERIRAGVLQGMGENVLAAVRAFSEELAAQVIGGTGWWCWRDGAVVIGKRRDQ